ncbi:MAG: sulfatase [Carboxylicivirga sp.]|jgi:arylsulfatase A-like enzyme|nr:sulfatase [Carboxylicivirga sp.]
MALRYILISLLIALSLCGSAQVDDSQRYNIVFLFADDWGRYASIYDKIDGGNTINSVFETSNIDKIANDGIVFTNAHVPSPSCTPCRSSILSGQYFYNTGMGAILQGAIWDEKIPSYPPLLRDAGYHMGYTYKVWGPGNTANEPYGGGKERKVDSVEIAKRKSIWYTTKLRYFNNPEDELAYESGGCEFNSFSKHVSASKNKKNKVDELLGEVRQNFTSFLDARDEGQPFCYWFGPTNTHRPWVKGSGKDLWGLDPDKLKGKMPSFIPDVPEVREDFNDYLGEVLAWDLSVGLIYDILEEKGELDNTILIISGDHGIPGFPRAKTNLYDIGTSVALIAKYPGSKGRMRVVDDFVNLMDLAPTFVEVAGLDIPEEMDGKSILPVLKSNKSGLIDPERTFVMTGRERHVASAREGNLPYPQRAIRTKDYLFIRNFKPDRWPIGTIEKGLRDIDNGPTKRWMIKNNENPDFQLHWGLAFGKRPYEELYDLKQDPDQMKNLAEDERFVSIRNKMASILDSVMEETNDPRLQNQNCIFDKMPYIGGK